MAALEFTGKTVLVVGGSSGIGNGIARAFRDAGASVHIWGTRASATDYGDDDESSLEGLIYTQMDVKKTADIETYAPPFDRLDVLVQSQGLALYKRREFEIEDFRTVIDVNLISLMACASKFKDMLVAAQGSIVIVSSSAGFVAAKGNPAYSASKSGAVGLTRTLAQAWGPEGVRVNGIAPGLVATRMTAVTTNDPRRRQAMLDRIPLGRLGSVDDMANVALFLASPLSSYILGQTFMVDGGMFL
jgi:3-oxoacyl-[acyl-carrier protein] reductase